MAMSELPTPQYQTNSGVPDPAHVPAVPSAAQPADPKQLLAHASGQVEKTIAGTKTDPSKRADEVHAIKANYLKARYGIEAGK